MRADDMNKFEAEAWYKNGSTIYQNIHGVLTMDNSVVSMLDSAGSKVFQLALNEVKEVKVSPGALLFKSASKEYLVTLFDIAKTGNKMIAGDIAGVVGNIPVTATGIETAAIKSTFSSAASTAQFELLLRKNNVTIHGSSNVRHEKKKIIIIVLITILLIIGIAVAAGSLLPD